MDGQEATVKQILEGEAKSGVSQKTGKPWSQARVELSNGESVFIFNPIAVGDTVVAKQNGEYLNWGKKQVDAKHEEIMKALRAIYKAVTTGEDTLEPPKPQPKKDTVTEPIDGEEVSLDDIPF